MDFSTLVTKPADAEKGKLPDFYSEPTTWQQDRAFRAAQTEVRNTERDLRFRGIDIDAEMPQEGFMATLLDPIFDALQTGQFVTAGTALELQKSGNAREALKRAASEFANALPGIEVDEMVEIAGVKFPKATRPSWAEVLEKSDAKIFNDEEYGRWSVAAAGFALDVLLDPLTLVNPASAVKKIPRLADAAGALSSMFKESRVGADLGRKFIPDFELKEWARKNPDKAASVEGVLQARMQREAEMDIGMGDLVDRLREIGQGMNATEVRLLHTFMQDPKKLGEVVELAAINNPERKQELLKKADKLREFYLDIGKKDAESGLLSPAVLDFYTEGNTYVPGRYPVTRKTEQASDELISLMRGRGMEIEDVAARPNVTGDVGLNAQLGAGTPTAAKKKKFMSMPERLTAGVPTELDMTLAAQRGMESVRWDTTQRFVKAVLDDETIARRLPSGHIAELANKTEDDFVRELTESGMAKAEAETLARQKMDELTGFKERLKRDGYGIYKPLRKGESAYVLPEPFIKELDLASKIMENKTESHKFLRQVQDLQNIWKGYAVLSPGFHMRNMFSNWWNNGLADVKTPTYLKAYMLQRGAGEEISVKVGDKVYKGNDLYELARKQNVIGTGVINKDLTLDVEREILGSVVPRSSGREMAKGLREGGEDLAADIAQASPQQGIADVFKAVLGPENYALKGNRLVGRAIENNARLAHFIDRLEKGNSITDAAMSTKKYLFDYNELTDFEKDWMKTLIPFYAWMRFNIPLQFQSILEKPARYAAMSAKPIQAIETLSEDWQDIPTPDYFQELRAVRLPRGASDAVAWMNRQLSGEEETGLQPTYLNPNLPFQDVNRLTGQDILSGLSPLPKLFFEQTPTQGFSIFLDREIERYPGQPAETDVLGTGYRLSGKTEDAARSLLPTYGKIQRLRQRADQGQLASQLLTEVFGIKVMQTDIDKINRGETYNRREQLRNLKRKYRDLGEIP